ncbi:molybdate ABC transporter permease [Methanoculleus sediminis]|uniref:Molybdate ABC transporter permease n=1 Tax=Methanoculleus sediminis TaxID=1550566 RepID=A0A0H1R656_9EURY|nr:ABC transporter permease [Methanoculleus sediminis]KLK88187.1 molybdate ABC transporter permease [Methanoculleus sediminis]
MNLKNSSYFRMATVAVALLIAAFIVMVLVGVVTHSPPAVLIECFLSEEIQFAIRLSIITSVISTLLCILVAVPVAYALARYTFPGKTVMNMLMDIPMALPPLVAGVGLLLFFGVSPVGKSLAAAGLAFVFTPLGIIMAQFFVNLPYMLRVTRSTFQGVNPRYEYVAKTLGCTDAQAFWRVTLPMSWNGLLAGSVITWSKGIGEFGAGLMLAGATRMKTETLPLSLFLNMSTGKLEYAIAAATILIMISVVSLYAFERYGGATHVY